VSRLYPNRPIKILAAARNWRDVAVLGGRSIFSVEPVWTTSNIQVLDQVFTQSPDETDRAFSTKLQDQLKACSASVKQLAAEIMWTLERKFVPNE
jgi:5-methylcytosine-specific restriction protein B